VRTVALIGAPSSMGAHAPGQERAPRALRDAGVVERLRRAGREVADRGDATLRRW
jgi:arginase